MVDSRPLRTPKPSGKVRANDASAAPQAKVTKVTSARRGGSGGGSGRRGGAARSQSQPPTRKNGPSLAARGAQSQALNQLFTEISSSPPLSSPNGSKDGDTVEQEVEVPRGTVDEDADEEENLDGTPEPPSNQSAFIFISQIRIVCEKDDLNSTLRRYT
ncbi:hypothetical protein B0A48_18701 [Cryoendolithus antarcticus]|uniref:Uncharacterized protein n=1 Tax=Cryoendolithus antarcticus TaxID=1507870 RepID=A0A1V8S850_9PEZI|nr:hypothetical protein B0A48_18701 [Cryoendolithus antarcticus]